MQTFLPYPSFVDSAGALDAKRLGKQRVETFQLLRALTVPGHGWRHHPAAKMWDGHLPALVAYGLTMTDEWVAQGRNDTVREKILAFAPRRRRRRAGRSRSTALDRRRGVPPRTPVEPHPQGCRVLRPSIR